MNCTKILTLIWEMYGNESVPTTQNQAEYFILRRRFYFTPCLEMLPRLQRDRYREQRKSWFEIWFELTGRIRLFRWWSLSREVGMWMNVYHGKESVHKFECNKERKDFRASCKKSLVALEGSITLLSGVETLTTGMMFLAIWRPTY